MESKFSGHAFNSHFGIGKFTQGKSIWPFANLTNALSGLQTAKQNIFLHEGNNDSFEMEYDTFKEGIGEVSSIFITRSTSEQVNEHGLSDFKSDSIDAEESLNSAKSFCHKSGMTAHKHPDVPRKGMNKHVFQEIVNGVYTFSAGMSESEILEGSWRKSEIAGSTSATDRSFNRQLGKTFPVESLSFRSTGQYSKQRVDHRESAEQVWEYAFTSDPIPALLTGKHAFNRQPFCGLPAKSTLRSGKITLRRLPIRSAEKQTLATIKMLKIEGLPRRSERFSHKGKEYEAKWKQTAKTVRVIKQLLSGGFAGVISRTAVAPLDLIKAYLITSHGLRGSKKSALTICRDILEKDGWQGLFRGNLVNCIRVAPSKAIELCIFETVRRALNKDDNPLKHMAATIAGGAAGMAGTIATYPLELIRTRISVQPELYSGLLQAIRKIARDEGFLAFYSGLSPSLVGVFPYAATNYFVYDGLRAGYLRSTGQKNVPSSATLMFAAIAAAASSAVTYPLEVARRQMQLSLTGAFVRNSTIGVILDIYQHEGFWALYRGLGTTWLKLIPAAGISFVCYETARLALQIDDASMVKSESPIIAEQEG